MSVVDTKLGKSLRGLGFKTEDIHEVLGAPKYKQLLTKDISEVPESITLEIMGILSVASKPSEENAETILKRKARAIFAYGTLRADYSPTGDKWGVTAGGGCKWTHAEVLGFNLYQEPKLYYPYATKASSSGSKIIGTLLSWPSDEKKFVAKLQECNSIEGYDPSSNSGLYKRVIVNAIPLDSKEKTPVEAYMYYQEKSNERIKTSKHFADGDWLKPQGTTETAKEYLGEKK